MEKVHKFTLDLTRGINDTSIEVVTGDYAAHKFEITLVEDGYKPFNLEGTIVRLIVLKPDGHTIQQDCTIVDNNGKVSVLLMLDTINVPGTCKAEIQIWDNEVANKRLTSAQFYFRVRKSLQDDETVESTDQFSMLQSALEQAQNIDEKIQNKADLDENGKVPLSQLPDNIGVDEELRQEVEEARGGHTSLNDRLGTSEQNLTSHLAEIVSQSNGVHGLKIEEGTFTPLLQQNGIANNNTYSIQEGKYYRVGKLVYIKLRIKIDVWDTDITGPYMQIRGLPFATTGTAPATIGRVMDITFDKGVLARVEGNYIALFNLITNNTSALVSANFRNGSEIDVSAVYNIA